jgi:hypothetical protein
MPPPRTQAGARDPERTLAIRGRMGQVGGMRTASLSDQARRLAELRDVLAAGCGDSAALAADPAENPVCSVTVDPAARCVVLVWKRYATTPQIRFVHELMLDLLQRNGLHDILADDTLLPTIHVDDRRWIVEDWMPRARAGGLARVSTKSPVGHFGRVAAEEVHGLAPDEIRIAAFDTMDAARRWLAT